MNYHTEYLTPLDSDDPILKNLESNSETVGIDHIEWYWDCINEYIRYNHNAFGSIFGMSNFIQLPHSISFLCELPYVYDKELLCNELKYLIEFGEILNAYLFKNIDNVGKDELEYIRDSIKVLYLIQSKCLKVLNGNQ